MNTLTEVEKAYLAGFVDGEGCIHISKQKQKEPRCALYLLQVVISQNNEPYLLHWRNKAGVGRVYKGSMNVDYMAYKYAVNVKQSFSWRISALEAGELLKAIEPFLIIKRQQAVLALEFQATKGTYNRSGKGKNVVPAEAVEIRERLRNSIMGLNSHALHE